MFLGPAAVLLKKNIKVRNNRQNTKRNPRFDSIFYNKAPVLKRTFACPRLKNDFLSFLSSSYVRTTNIYWRNSSLFSTTHPTFLHSCPFRRSTKHILFRAISLVGKIFGTYLACSSLRTANPFRIERPIKRKLNRYGKKASWIVKWYGKYGRFLC